MMFPELELAARDEGLKFVNLVYGKTRLHHGDVENLESIVNLSESFTCLDLEFGVFGIVISLI